VALLQPVVTRLRGTTIVVLAALACAAPAQASVRGDVRSAAHRHHVPVRVLRAVGWTATHLRMPHGRSLDGGYGIMDLRPAQVRRAARLTGRSRHAIRTRAAANVDAAAALLAAAHRSGASWRRAVARVGHGERFAAEALGAGARAAQTLPGEEPGTAWTAASSANYSSADRPYDQPIDTIVIHETQGSYAGTVQWFANPRADASAHFVVRSSDGAITQMVHEHDVAWHAGNHDVNWRSIGIEHEGYVDDCSWNTDAMYRSSAMLVAHLAARYGIPVDRAHIIGHSEVPDPFHAGRYGGADGHTDPGPCWNWDLYMSYIQADLAGIPPGATTSTPGQPGYRQIVDNGTRGRFHASKNWKRTHVHRPYFGGARVTTAKPRSDTARFRMLVPSTGNYTLYARWTASRANSNRVPIGVHTVGGLRWTYVNQRHHGRKWRRIGTFQLAQGDSWSVVVSRWTHHRGTVVADGVKLVAAP
jgi:N-acetylmuramoyl-L-alanine amidase